MTYRPNNFLLENLKSIKWFTSRAVLHFKMLSHADERKSSRRDPEMQNIMDWGHYKINTMYSGVHVMFTFN